MKTFLKSRSTSSPARAYAYNGFPSFFRALCIGGRCRIGPVKTRTTSCNSSSSKSGTTGSLYRTFGVAGRTDEPQSDHRLVSFVCIEQRVGKLGGLPKADWQQPRSQWVERSGMSGFDPAKQASYALQGGV